jgi:hypothetical protein
MPKAPAVPVLKCECGSTIEIAGRRIGDSVECPSCKKLKVVLRSKVTGDVLPAFGAPGTISDRLPEVQESLQRIRLRRAGHAARDVALFPPGAVFGAGAFGFYLAAILQGQNLAALGFPQEGRRLQVLGVASYLVLGACLLAASVRLVPALPGGSQLLLGIGLALLVLGAITCTAIGHGRVRAAFEAGAQPASVMLPALFGFLLAVAQLFVFKFVDFATNW